jgi:glycosyltransferase involved in cell wall biosynthesis
MVTEMRICYVSSNQSIHDKRFIDKFIEQGYKTHVVSFSNNKAIRTDGIKFYNFHIESNLLKVWPITRYVFFLRKLLKKIKPDVLHGGWVRGDGFISALAGYHPFLLMPWGSDILIYPKESIVTKMITKFTLKRADMITCDCEVVKREIIKLSGYPEDKIITFPQGIDLKKFNSNIHDSEIRNKLGWEDKRILIMTRNFSPVYGIEYFLSALPEVIEKDPNTRVILCGDGPLKNKFIEFLKEHNLDKYVFFAGHVENDELPKYLNAADIYISTSLSDGTSLSLLEAMACGLPTVVTDVPANREWVEDGKNGYIVPRKDSIIVAKKLVQLLQDETRQKKFGRENIKIAKERADWDKNFEKLERIYKCLI